MQSSKVPAGAELIGFWTDCSSGGARIEISVSAKLDLNCAPGYASASKRLLVGGVCEIPASKAVPLVRGVAGVSEGRGASG